MPIRDATRPDGGRHHRWRRSSSRLPIDPVASRVACHLLAGHSDVPCHLESVPAGRSVGERFKQTHHGQVPCRHSSANIRPTWCCSTRTSAKSALLCRCSRCRRRRRCCCAHEPTMTIMPIRIKCRRNPPSGISAAEKHSFPALRNAPWARKKK